MDQYLYTSPKLHEFRLPDGIEDHEVSAAGILPVHITSTGKVFTLVAARDNNLYNNGPIGGKRTKIDGEKPGETLTKSPWSEQILDTICREYREETGKTGLPIKNLLTLPDTFIFAGKTEYQRTYYVTLVCHVNSNDYSGFPVINEEERLIIRWIPLKVLTISESFRRYNKKLVDAITENWGLKLEG